MFIFCTEEALTASPAPRTLATSLINTTPPDTTVSMDTSGVTATDGGTRGPPGTQPTTAITELGGDAWKGDITGNDTAQGVVEGAGATAAIPSTTDTMGGDGVAVAEKLIETRPALACHCNHKHTVHTSTDHCKQEDLTMCEQCSPLICRKITKHSQSCFRFSDCSNASLTTTTTVFPDTTTPAVLPKDNKSVLMAIVILAVCISIGIFGGVGYFIVKKMRNVRPAPQAFNLYSIVNPCYEPMEEVSLED